MKKIIFFNPNAQIWNHALPEAKLAQDFQKIGLNVYFAKCSSILKSNCTTYWSKYYTFKKGITDDYKHKNCINCIKIQNLKNSNLFFKTLDIESQISKLDIKKINTIFNELKKKKFIEVLNFKLEDVPIGKFCAYEVLLVFKKKNLNLNIEEKKQYYKNLYNCLITFFFKKKIINKKLFHYMVVFNSLYSSNRVAYYLFDKFRKKSVFNINIGELFYKRNSFILITRAKSDIENLIFLKNHLWKKFKKIKITEYESQLIKQHFKNIFQSKLIFTYSKPAKTINIFNYFGIKKNQKILLAVCSSMDEQFSSKIVGSYYPKKKLFVSTIHWIKFLYNFAKINPSIFVVIRLHPRDFGNLRQKSISDNAKEIMLFSRNVKNLQNFKFDWPEDKLSIYSILPKSDLVLAQGSSVVLEAKVLKKEVLLDSLDYSIIPNDLVHIALTEQNYKKKILEIISIKNIDNKKNNDLVYFYRWLALKLVYTTKNFEKEINFRETNFVYRLLNKFFKRQFYKYLINRIKLSSSHNELLLKFIKNKKETNLAETFLKTLPIERISNNVTSLEKKYVYDNYEFLLKEIK